MVFDVLALGILVAVYWRAWTLRGPGIDASLMPVEDRPPLEANDPMPRTRLRRYVGEGLEDIEDYLSRDQNAW